MPTTPQDIDALLTIRSEGAHLEFKEAKTHGDFEELVDYCAAISNEGGGRILLGVTNAPPRKVVGSLAFSVPERTITGIHERIGMKVEFEEIAHPAGRVLVFHVPPRGQGQPVHHKGRFLMRVGDALVSMSAEQIKKILDEGKPEWELEPALADCSSEQVVQLLDTAGYFDLRQIPYPATREAVLERFESERLLKREPSGHWTITNLGAILFAKKLDHFDRLAGKAPRVIVYEGRDKLRTKTDKPGVKGYAVGFEGLIEFINGLVPSNEVIEQALRKEVKMFPEIAIRELVANALIHQDFSETGASVVIEIYSDRMEISNPGKPFISPDRFIDENQSRNERLARLMRQLRICEEKGSGIDKVVRAAEVFQLPAPDFRVGERRFTAVLFAHLPLEEMDRNDRIRACYQHCCLRYVTNQQMTNQSLRERFHVGEDKVATVSLIIDPCFSANPSQRGPVQKCLCFKGFLLLAQTGINAPRRLPHHERSREPRATLRPTAAAGAAVRGA